MKRKPNKPQKPNEMLRAIMMWDISLVASILYGILGKNNNAKIAIFVVVAIYTAFLIRKIKKWYDQM